MPSSALLSITSHYTACYICCSSVECLCSHFPLCCCPRCWHPPLPTPAHLCSPLPTPAPSAPAPTYLYLPLSADTHAPSAGTHPPLSDTATAPLLLQIAGMCCPQVRLNFGAYPFIFYTAVRCVVIGPEGNCMRRPTGGGNEGWLTLGF